ncbi:N-methyl-L-tryptophan oxidase [Devosia rhodophyticola]|uniref:N-methyl-L-tryptophan oxidase n=1 Tax=Devosia rhodophyticola TaxID=3026423 RepID=A0ABY7YT73_9HYPH|nr:N-methyl-L-tryptophan oxidase [Devosia rhodophyticola]WDR04538.1 N-methyl-L-tryptophan oxidase [Devosia rhodophyticola]
MRQYDYIVVGLGAMGSAALWHLAKSGARVLGIDRFTPPHNQGSTHGETRITRRAIGEGEALVPLALRSHQLWAQIEAETGADLFHQTGSLIIGRPGDNVERPGRTGFVDRSIAAARRFDIDHEILTADEITARYPNFTPQPDEIGYFEPGGGYLRVEACVAANLTLAQRHNATIQLDTEVRDIAADQTAVRIVTADETILAGHVAVTAGAWAPALLGAPFIDLLKPTRQVMHWFMIEPDARSIWEKSPVFMWPHGDDESGFFYGFPSIDGQSMKTADECYGPASDPNAIDRLVTPEQSSQMYQSHMAGRFAGLTPQVARTQTCIYTASPDSGFIIDQHPQRDNVLVVSPCSGHGFKHSAAIGEAVAARLLQQPHPIDLNAFSLSRFGTNPATSPPD